MPVPFDSNLVRMADAIEIECQRPDFVARWRRREQLTLQIELALDARSHSAEALAALKTPGGLQDVIARGLGRHAPLLRAHPGRISRT
jgi:hypothetical protein